LALRWHGWERYDAIDDIAWLRQLAVVEDRRIETGADEIVFDVRRQRYTQVENVSYLLFVDSELT